MVFAIIDGGARVVAIDSLSIGNRPFVSRDAEVVESDWKSHNSLLYHSKTLHR